MANINGTNGDNTLKGTNQSDVIKGLEGDDILTGLGAMTPLTVAMGLTQSQNPGMSTLSSQIPS